jgi:hypothetical protein
MSLEWFKADTRDFWEIHDVDGQEIATIEIKCGEHGCSHRLETKRMAQSLARSLGTDGRES